jgi:anti-sigma factor RsiW
MTSELHLTEEQLAGFLSDDLSAEERLRVDEHLDGCDACRAEAIAVSRLEATVPSAPAGASSPRRMGAAVRRSRVPAGVVGLLAAAGLAAVLLWSGDPGIHGFPDEERFGHEAIQRLETRFPAAGAVLPRDSVAFSWTDTGADEYRLTISAADGALLWSQTAADTVVVPPATLDLPAGETLFWYVDALDVGIAARSGIQSFEVIP